MQKCSNIRFFLFTEVKNTFANLKLEYENFESTLAVIEDQCLKVAYDSLNKEEKLKRAEHCLKLIQKKIRSEEKEKYDVSY